VGVGCGRGVEVGSDVGDVVVAEGLTVAVTAAIVVGGIFVKVAGRVELSDTGVGERGARQAASRPPLVVTSARKK